MEKDGAIWKPICTGSLITASWVITASHCLPQKGRRFAKVIGGAANFSNPNAVERTIAYFVTQKDVPIEHRNGIGRDLALIRLMTPFPMTDKIGTIKMTSGEWDGPRKCIAAGYGLKSKREKVMSEVLQFAKVTALHGFKKCPCINKLDKPFVVCLKPQRKVSVCNGDSGGALVCDGIMYGVAHHIMDAYGCNALAKEPVCGSYRTVSIYLYLCPQLRWLRTYIREVPIQPMSCGTNAILLNTNVFLVILLNLLHRCWSSIF